MFYTYELVHLKTELNYLNLTKTRGLVYYLSVDPKTICVTRILNCILIICTLCK